ncbi:hypothetical protein VFPFJ_02839 [Purpureocillium lilacinum]|uniref:Uncharacterized protein n=1 Tax=Purpureocillium lilacinum TaxID=33203 RepID=A0A179HTI1_PURLI|nr:hypothetical protein VFPFJ_02839 [Purpureocillium lilacinum]OAQ93677.1 hypothetical protein VFPFJ_02839 [Purpureocillium lilacinum]
MTYMLRIVHYTHIHLHEVHAAPSRARLLFTACRARSIPPSLFVVCCCRCRCRGRRRQSQRRSNPRIPQDQPSVGQYPPHTLQLQLASGKGLFRRVPSNKKKRAESAEHVCMQAGSPSCMRMVSLGCLFCAPRAETPVLANDQSCLSAAPPDG